MSSSSLDVLPSAHSLAVRYRPRSFAQLVGQRHVVAVLRQALATGQIPQQLLFAGGSGLGKTTVARLCAAALLCETPLDQRANADACGTCASCLDVTDPERSHPDLIELDAASNGGKDNIRDLADRTLLAPMRARWKVYIVDEVQGLSGAGAQAFLKLLEEPPPHVIFMLATTDPHKVPRTNRGRCLTFELYPPTLDELTTNLKRVADAQQWELSDEAAAAVVQATEPELGVRGTVMTLAKLAGPLGQGVTLTPALLAEILQTPSPEQMHPVTAAIAAGDAAAAVQAAMQIRPQLGDPALRSALVDWARQGFVTAVSSSVGGVPLATWRYEQLLAAPAGAAWTDCTIARLATPGLDPTPATAAVLEADAQASCTVQQTLTRTAQEAAQGIVKAQAEGQALLAQLHAAVASATALLSATQAAAQEYEAKVAQAQATLEQMHTKIMTTRPPVLSAAQPTPRAVPVPQPPVTTAPETPVAAVASRRTPTAPPRAATTSSPRPQPGTATDKPSRQFLEAVARRSSVAAGLVRSCRVQVSSSGVQMQVPPALRSRITAEVSAILRDAAGEQGLPLALSQIPAPAA